MRRLVTAVAAAALLSTPATAYAAQPDTPPPYGTSTHKWIDISDTGLLNHNHFAAAYTSLRYRVEKDEAIHPTSSYTGFKATDGHHLDCLSADQRGAIYEIKSFGWWGHEEGPHENYEYYVLCKHGQKIFGHMHHFAHDSTGFYYGSVEWVAHIHVYRSLADDWHGRRKVKHLSRIDWNPNRRGVIGHARSFVGLSR